jgi:hypothetical protein
VSLTSMHRFTAHPLFSKKSRSKSGFYRDLFSV